MSAPKVKSFDAVSLYWDSPSRAVARKQQAIAKMTVPTENWFDVSSDPE
jgi:hypothetical protein